MEVRRIQAIKDHEDSLGSRMKAMKDDRDQHFEVMDQRLYKYIKVDKMRGEEELVETAEVEEREQHFEDLMVNENEDVQVDLQTGMLSGTQLNKERERQNDLGRIKGTAALPYMHGSPQKRRSGLKRT